MFEVLLRRLLKSKHEPNGGMPKAQSKSKLAETVTTFLFEMLIIILSDLF